MKMEGRKREKINPAQPFVFPPISLHVLKKTRQTSVFLVTLNKPYLDLFTTSGVHIPSFVSIFIFLSPCLFWPSRVYFWKCGAPPEPPCKFLYTLYPRVCPV